MNRDRLRIISAVNAYLLLIAGAWALYKQLTYIPMPLILLAIVLLVVNQGVGYGHVAMTRTGTWISFFALGLLLRSAFQAYEHGAMGQLYTLVFLIVITLLASIAFLLPHKAKANPRKANR